VDLGFVALGLVQGALAGLNALGLTLLWRTTRVVNLAQPAIGLVGGVLTGMLVAASGWGFWWAAPLGISLGALLGFLSERLVLAPLAALPRTVPMVATIGLASLFIALQSGIPFFFGGRLPSYDVDIGVEVFVFPVLLKGPHLLALIALPAATSGVWWFVHRTRVGAAAVAAGQDLERAQALGVHAGFVRAVAWTIAGALSGLAGVLSIPVLGYSLGDGVAATVILLSLAPAVLAGLRSLPATAAASLVVGVGYQFALVEAPTAGAAEVFLAIVIVAALFARRRPLARAALTARASSWAAATAPPPLPRAVRRDRTWRRLTAWAAGVLVVAATLPPLWLSPSADVRYGTCAAFVIAAVAVATAWMFSGELALGHWGVAALGATVAHATSGPLVVRTTVGLAVGAATGLALGLVARRRGGLAGAVAGLAIAVAAPYWLVRSGTRSLDLDPQLVACSAGAIAAGLGIAVTRLRNSRSGVRLVAARDEARRAVGFGISPARSLGAGMALSGAIAAAAGIVYLAAVPAGVAPGAFDAARSFDVVAFAVVGGLGSAIGAGVGAAGLLAAGVLLPAPWASIATGAGVVWVVLFAPGGASSALSRMRDLIARSVCGDLFPSAPPRPDDETIGVLDIADADGIAIVAGADTRDAMSTPSVRAAALAAWSMAGPAAAALFGGPMMVADHLGHDPGPLGPWQVLLTGAVAVAVGLSRWRSWQPVSGVPAEVLVGGAAAVALGAFVITGDRQMVSVLALAAPSAGAYLLASAARRASSAVVPRTRAAAAGVVVAGGVAGLLGAAHLAVVASGNDVLDGARWAVAYLAVAALSLAAATARGRSDRRRSHHRMMAPTRAVGRRRWAPLRVESLTVDYRDHRILEGVDLEIASGELVALVGGNGAGKSTLLRAVAGLVPVAAGRIDVAGHEITALRVDERAASGVAFVSGAHPIFPDMTVRENLRVGGYLTHRTGPAFAAALEHVLSFVPALAGRVDTRAGLLSGGEQRQLAVAQMLFRRPALLLADELTLGLDLVAQATVLGLLRTLADDGIGVVVVDHDVRALAGIADRVVVVRHGSLEHFDPADFDAARDELLPARFLASVTP
jgi:ABC-type branched-subunit amino acid transport system ATPase component/branched-subunit amino acid ABC-type transport system permease component